jgi:uracil-DNA glycosylase
MTPSRPVSNAEASLDASEIVQATAALAAHFERLGMQFAPAAVASDVQHWREQFAVDSSSQGSVPPSTPVTSQTAVPNVRVDSTKRTTATTPPTPPVIETTHQDTDTAATGLLGTYPGQSLPVVERTNRLSEMAQMVAGCTRCDVLAKCRTKTVFGEGSVTPRVVFFGEAPGADEDRTGRPFVGLAGQLLNKMIQACTFTREEVYILNTVKCRPPGNRNPEPSELQNCREYFVSQLEILRPDYIVCLGLISSQALLSSTLSIGRLRGKFHQYCESKVVVTYHPAYLLRNPDAKKAAWDDLQMMLRDMGITPGR